MRRATNGGRLFAPFWKILLRSARSPRKKRHPLRQMAQGRRQSFTISRDHHGLKTPMTWLRLTSVRSVPCTSCFTATRREVRARPRRRGGRGGTENRLDARHDPRERRAVNRLRRVRERRIRDGMDLDDRAVETRRGGRVGQRSDEATATARVRGIDDHRKVRQFFEPERAAEVEHVARLRIEAANAALAESRHSDFPRPARIRPPA